MPRYFFHRLGKRRDHDREGLDLLGLEEARWEAVAFASDSLRSDKYQLWDGGEIRVEATDAAGNILFIVIVTAQIRTE